jgi:hypothetical protein
MSVCIVAEYPFPTTLQIGGTAVGAIVCTDTRLTTPEGKSFKLLAAKQRPVSENILVCSTSSHFAVTTAALNYSSNRKVSLRRLGANMRAHHEKWGGFTELLAVVWHRDKESPQVLELMPESYEPRLRRGIIGIGDSAVLQRFREVLRERMSRNPLQMTPEAKEGLSRSIARMGGTFIHDFGPELLSGAGEIAGFLENAIVEVGGPTVGPPLVVDIVMPKLGCRRVQIPSFNIFTMEARSLTARTQLALPSTKRLAKIARWNGDRTATQLLSWEPVSPPAFRP